MERIVMTAETDEAAIDTAKLHVKIFVHKDVREAEKAIGLWLQQHDVLIDHVTQSQSEKGGSFMFVLSLFYRKND